MREVGSVMRRSIWAKWMMAVWLLAFALAVSGCASTQKESNAVDAGDERSLEGRLDDLAVQIAGELSGAKGTRVAVPEFVDLEGKRTDLGRYLAEEVAERLARRRKFDVIERQRLAEVVGDRPLSAKGKIDEGVVRTLGGQLKVDVVVVGSMSDWGSEIKVNARLVSAQVEAVFAVASVMVIKDAFVRRLMGQKIIATSNPTGTAEKKIAVEQVIEERFAFQLVRCERDEDAVTCILSVTNRAGEERELSIRQGGIMPGSGTRMVDDLGDEFWLSSAKIADEEMAFETGGGRDQALTRRLEVGVPVALELNFEGVMAEAKKVALLEVNCGRFRVRFWDAEIGE